MEKRAQEGERGILICSCLQFGYMSSVKGPERAWREVRERPSGLCGFLKLLEIQSLLSNMDIRWQRRPSCETSWGAGR